MSVPHITRNWLSLSLHDSRFGSHPVFLLLLGRSQSLIHSEITMPFWSVWLWIFLLSSIQNQNCHQLLRLNLWESPKVFMEWEYIHQWRFLQWPVHIVFLLVWSIPELTHRSITFLEHRGGLYEPFTYCTPPGCILVLLWALILWQALVSIFLSWDCFSHMFHRTGLLRPAIHDGVLAPTQSQRLQYAYWLCVYGKDMVKCTRREAVLIDEYIVCGFTMFHFTNFHWLYYLSDQGTLKRVQSSSEFFIRNGENSEPPLLYDVFEPNHIESALSRPAFNLGHLIFSSVGWQDLGRLQPSSSDPITALFKERGLLWSYGSSVLDSCLMPL